MKNLLLLILSFVATFAFAQNTYFVSTTGSNSNSGLSISAPFLTIQHAVNSANDNDSIILIDGQYSEQLNITKSLVMTSEYIYGGQNAENHISSTILVSPNSSTLITCNSNNNVRLQLIGFTIKDCPSKVLSLSSTNQSLIRNMRFLNNGNIGVSVLDIYGNAQIKDCFFQNNQFANLIALSAGGTGFPMVNACEFKSNGLASQFSKSLIYSYNRSIITNNLIYNNIGTMFNGGCNSPLDTIILSHNTIVANQGYGVTIDHCYGGIKGYFNNNIIENNSLGCFWFVSNAPGYSIIQIKNNKIVPNPYFTQNAIQYAVTWQNNDSSANQVFTYPIIDKSQLSLPNSSTLIGAGLTQSYDFLQEDFYNISRPMPSGSTPDIGAIENALSQPQILLTDSISVCANAAPLNLLSYVQPITGVFTGTGIIDNVFDPSQVSVGVNKVFYTLSGSNWSTSVDSMIINVLPVPSFTINATTSAPYCMGQSVQVNADQINDAAYSWYENNQLIATENGQATTINSNGTYKSVIQLLNGCSVTSNDLTISFNQLPVVSLADFTPICNTQESIVNLAGGSPIGGVFSGVGVSNNELNPALIPLGKTPITYTYTDTNGCVNSIAKHFQKLPANIAINADDACFNNPIIATIQDTASYSITWYKDNAIFKQKLPGYNDTAVVLHTNFNAAEDLFIAANGDKYIVEMGHHRVTKITPSGVISTVAGGNGQGSALNQFNNPIGVHVDAQGNVYVVDQNNHRVMRWAPGATTGTLIVGTAGGTQGSGLNRLDNPVGIAFDSQGRMYIGDSYNHRVMRYNVSTYNGTALSGIIVAGNGSAGSALNQFNVPRRIFIDGSNNLYVGDDGNARIMKFPANSTSSTSGIRIYGENGHGSGLNQVSNPVSDIFVDANSIVYISDYHNERILRLTPNSTTAEIVAGGNGYGWDLNQASRPTGLHLDAKGDIYVTQRDHGRMLKFSFESLMTDTIVPIESGTYFAQFNHRLVTCPANSVNITINRPVTSLTSSAGQYVCDGSLTTLATTSNDTYSYQWFKDNNNISGETNNTYGASETGTYSVVVTDTNGCSDSPTTFTINPLPVVSVTSTGICAGDTLITNTPDSTVSRIEWYNDLTLINTQNSTFSTDGEVIMSSGLSNGNGLNWPIDVVYDNDGYMYYSEYNNHRVTRVSPDGLIVEIVAGGNGAGTGLNQLKFPIGITIDNQKNLYIADSENHRIVKWEPGANTGILVAGVTNQLGSTIQRLNYPYDVELDNENNLLIADFQNHRVIKWVPGAPSGTVVIGNGSAGNSLSLLNNPTGLDYINNTLYIADRGNGRVLKIQNQVVTKVTGSVTNQILTNGNPEISNVCVDVHGNIYTTQHVNNSVIRWNPVTLEGELVAGGNGNGSSFNQLGQQIYGITLDPNNNLVVCDPIWNQRIIRFNRLPMSVDTLISTNSGAYTSKFSTIYGCSSLSNAITVFKPITSLTSSAGQYVCDGSLTTLATTSNDTYSYQWLKDNNNISGETNNTYGASETGTYSVVVTDTNGCSDSPTTFTINPLPVVSVTSTGICLGDTLITNTPDSTIAQITWYNGAQVVKTVLPEFDPSGEIVSGNNINGVNYHWGSQDVYVDDEGMQYISEVYYHRVLKYNPFTNEYTVVAGGNGDGNALNQLNYQRGIFVDGQKNIYIADKSNNRVVKWAPGATQGVVVAGNGTAGIELNRLDQPSDVYVDNQNRVYVLDAANHRIVRWAPNATTGVLIAGTGTAGAALNQMNYPYQWHVLNDSIFFVSDFNNARVIKFALGTAQGTVVAGGNGGGASLNQLNQPIGIYADIKENVYVADYNNHRIVRWKKGSNVGELVAGGNGNGNGLSQLSGPCGIYIAKDHKLYSTGGNRIIRFSPNEMTADSLIVAGPGTYKAEFTSYSKCSDDSQPVTIYNPVTSLTSSAGQYVCDGSLTTLATTSNDTYSYQWLKDNNNISGETNNTYGASETGTYSVVVTDTNGCSDSPTTFTINPLPVVSVTSTGICLGDTLITNTPDSTIAQITWYNGAQVVKTVLPEFDPIGECVVNNSQGYGWSGDVYLDEEGQVYFSDGDNHRVVRYTPSTNTFVVVAGGNGQGSALNQLNVPYGIFVDASKNVFVADYNNHRVVKWAQGATAGVIVAGNGTQGAGLNQLNGPTDIALDSQNRVYVADNNNHRVVRWSTSATSGVIVAGIGGGGSALNQLNNPYCLFITDDNELYISDYSNHRIVKYPNNATTGILVAGGIGGNNNTGLNQFNGPVGIFVDPNKNLYVSDYNNNRIMLWKKDANIGELLVGGTGGGHLLNQTSNPRGVFLRNNQIYVSTHNYENRVLKFTAQPISADSLIISVTGTYKVEFSSYSKCSDDSQPITIFNPITSLSSSAGQYVCEGSSTTLTTTSNGTYSYQWSKDEINISGATSNSYLATEPGSYRVIVTDANGCSDSPTTFNLNPLPQPNISSVDFCGGSDLVVNLSDSSAYSFSWYHDNNLINQSLPIYDSLGTLPFGNLGNYGIASPKDLFVTPNGDYYITDGGNQRVVKFTPGSTNFTIVAGGNGVGNGLNQLNNPWGVFVDNNNVVYVADKDNHRVMKWLPGATMGQLVAGTGTPGANLTLLNEPTDVWVDNQNAVYVVDRQNHRVVKWGQNATTGVLIAGNGVQGNSLSQLNYPFSCQIKNNTDLYVADSDNFRVLKFVIGDAVGVKVAGGSNGTNLNQLQGAMQMFVDDFSNIFIADYNNQRIVRWAAGSSIGKVVAGGNGYGGLLTQTPNPIAVNVQQNGSLQVLCHDYQRIMNFNLQSNLSDSIIPNSNGNYSVYVTNLQTGCSDTSAFINITQPILNLVSSIGEDVCFGDTSVLSSPFIEGYTYQWIKDGLVLPQTSNSISISSPGSYELLVTQSNGCTKQSDPFVILDSVAAYVTSNSLCLGADLLSNLPDSLVQMIQWYKDGQVIKQVLPDYEYNGQIFAGTGLNFNNLNLNGAFDVTIDKEGSIYMSDYHNHRVVKMNNSSTIWEVVAGGSGPGSSLSQLNYPKGIYVDKDLNVYVADYENHRVVKWPKNATSGIVVAGVSDSSGVSLNRLNHPVDVQLDQFGNVYVSDHDNHRVVKWSPGATSGSIVAGTNQAGSGLNQLHNPQGIIIKGDDLYIADYNNHRIMKFNPSSTNGTIILGGNGSGPYLDQVSYPIGIAIDKNENFYISEQNNHRVVRWQLNGLSGKQIIGNGQASSSLNQLNAPAGIHFAANGDLYIADFNNSRIIQFEPLLLDVDSIVAYANGSYSLGFKTYQGCENISSSYVVSGPQYDLVSSLGFSLCYGDTSLVSVITNNQYSYQWLFDGQVIDEENSSALNIFDIGEYQVVVQDSNGCSVTSNGVKIYPTDTVLLSASTSCLGSILTPSFNNDAYQISWYLNGDLLERNLGGFDSLGYVIAGNNVGSVNIWNASDIFIDDDGDYYISDFANHRVIRVSNDGNSWDVVAGGYGNGNWSNQLATPMGIYVDKDKNVYVADRDNHRVMKWSPGATTGILVAGTNGISGSGLNQLNNPVDVLLDKQGAMYISDKNNHRVVKWNNGSTSGVIVAGNGIPGNELNQLNNPYGIALDEYDRLYVADKFNHRIMKYIPGSTSGILMAGGNGLGSNLNQVSSPEWIETDNLENIYFSDHQNYRVLRFKNGIPNAEVVAAGNGPGGALNQLYNPSGIFLDSMANLYVMDGNWLNNRLLRFNSNIINDTTFIVDSAGVYAVGISNFGGCESLSNTLEIFHPNVTIANINSSCVSDQSFPLTIGLPIGGIYTGIGVTNGIFNPNVAGVGTHIIDYTFTDSHGCTDSAQTNLVIDALPNVSLNINGDLTFCDGDSVLVTVNDLGMSQQYQWYKNGSPITISSNSLLINDSSSIVYAHVINNSCEMNTDTISIVVNELPTVNAGNNTAICLGDSAVLSTTGTLAYTWSNILQPLTALSSSNSLNVNPIVNSSYVLKGVDVHGCSNYDTVSVLVNPLPNVDAGPLQTICYGNTVTLSASGAINYNWNNNITNGISFSPSSTTVYQVTGTDINGCSKTDSVLVTVNQLPNVNAGINDSICLGDSYTLTGSGALSYVWNNSVVNNVPFSPTVSSNYIVTGTDVNGCQKTDTMNLTVLALPVVSISTIDSTVICQGDTVNITSSVNSIVSYNWYNINTNLNQSGSSLNVLESGLFSLLVEDEFGCENASDTISVTVHQYPLATITPGSSLILCNGENVELNANQGPLLTYSWQLIGNPIPGGNADSLIVSSAGTYQLVTTYDGLCSTTSVPVTVVVNPLPVVSIAYVGPQEVCQGDTVFFTSTTNSSVSYQWYGSNGNAIQNQSLSTFNTIVPGSYYVEAENEFGCTQNSNTLSVANYLLPEQIIDICAVTVDTATNTNKVLWAKPPGAYRVWYYNIYRETAIAGQYGIVGSVLDTALTEFVDVLANPSVQSYRYKITHVDSCGIESVKSDLHRTIHLSSNLGINGEINLSWNSYEGFSYPTFDILRSVNGEPFTSIAQISSNSNTFSDINPPAGIKNYMISIDIPNGGCSPNKSYGSTISNKISVGTVSLAFDLDNSIEVYPNPSNGIFNILITNQSGDQYRKFEIVNAVGQLVTEFDIMPNEQKKSIDLSEFANGIYFLKQKDGTWLKQLIINQ